MKEIGLMIRRTVLKAFILPLIIGLTGPVTAEVRDSSPTVPFGASDIAMIFNATCASGRTTAAGLRESFESQGFTSDWQDDTYGYFTRVGLTANYHIYPGSWNCFVSAESAATSNLCEVLPADDLQVNARLLDGTCVANLPEHGLTVLVRNNCPDSSRGACIWMQATLTSDRECYSDGVFELTSLSRDFENKN